VKRNSTQAVKNKRKVLPTLDSARCLSLNGDICKLLTRRSDRELLQKGLKSYLCSRRRGKFRLPTSLSRLEPLFSHLTFRQVRDYAFWVRPENAFELRLNNRQFEQCKQVSPGLLWNPPCTIQREEACLVEKYRLNSRDWPRTSRPLWPSTPTFSEMLVASRTGHSFSGFHKPPQVNNYMGIRHLDDIRVAAKVVTNNVIGIRAYPLVVPCKFLPWFRYRQGLLILVVRHSYPAGLIRFLISRWIKVPCSLWLKEKCHLKYYLRSQERVVKSPQFRLPVSNDALEERIERIGTPQISEAREYLLSLFDSEYD